MQDFIMILKMLFKLATPPTLIAAILCVCWIAFLFPEWSRDFHSLFFLLLISAFVCGGMFSLSLAPVFSRHVNWRPISGTIVSSSTTKKEIRYESGNRIIDKTVYVPKIRCNYNVDGKEYSNDFVTDKEMPTEQDAAETALEQFFRGKEIDLYYDPKYPHISVITLPSTFEKFGPLIVGLILTLGGVLFGWILMVTLYCGSPIELGQVFKIPVPLEYKITRAIVKTFKIHESEQNRLYFYLDYLNSLEKFGYHHGDYNKYYTKKRVWTKKKETLERLVDITQHQQKEMFNYGEMLYDFLRQSDLNEEARAVLARLRQKYPAEFESSYLANNLKPVNEASK